MVEFVLPELPDRSEGDSGRGRAPPNRAPLLYLAMGPIRPSCGPTRRGRSWAARFAAPVNLDPADRELVILRVTGRHRAEHEWGVHVAYFGRTSGLTRSQQAATVTDEAPDPHGRRGSGRSSALPTPSPINGRSPTTKMLPFVRSSPTRSASSSSPSHRSTWGSRRCAACWRFRAARRASAAGIALVPSVRDGSRVTIAMIVSRRSRRSESS